MSKEFKWGDEVEWFGPFPAFDTTFSKWSTVTVRYGCPVYGSNNHIVFDKNGRVHVVNDIRHPKKTVTVEIDTELIERINQRRKYRISVADDLILFNDMCKAIAEGAGDE